MHGGRTVHKDWEKATRHIRSAPAIYFPNTHTNLKTLSADWHDYHMLDLDEMTEFDLFKLRSDSSAIILFRL